MVNTNSKPNFEVENDAFTTSQPAHNETQNDLWNQGAQEQLTASPSIPVRPATEMENRTQDVPPNQGEQAYELPVKRPRKRIPKTDEWKSTNRREMINKGQQILKIRSVTWLFLPLNGMKFSFRSGLSNIFCIFMIFLNI